jgi:hypothetical protein
MFPSSRTRLHVLGIFIVIVVAVVLAASSGALGAQGNTAEVSKAKKGKKKHGHLVEAIFSSLRQKVDPIRVG